MNLWFCIGADPEGSRRIQLSQGVEVNYSEKIGPAKGLSHGGKMHACFPGCSLPRNSRRGCVRSPTYVAQRFMWRSPGDARDKMFGPAKRHLL
jgi:hypothetical protein